MRKSLLMPNKKLNIRPMKMFSLGYKTHKFFGACDIYLGIVRPFLIKGRLFLGREGSF